MCAAWQASTAFCANVINIAGDEPGSDPQGESVPMGWMPIAKRLTPALMPCGFAVPSRIPHSPPPHCRGWRYARPGAALPHHHEIRQHRLVAAHLHPPPCSKWMWLHQEILAPLRIAAIAGATVMSRIAHHAGAHGIEFNVTLAHQQIGDILHDAGLVAPVP